jgi:hypothetical protein
LASTESVLASLIQNNGGLMRARQCRGTSRGVTDIDPSDLIVRLLMTAFGIIGLILASGAMDNE